MKLIRYYRYYGREKNFKSIKCVKKWENSDRRNSCFSNLCRESNDCFLHFSHSASVHFKPINYGKTGFFISGTLGWNRSNTFRRKITTAKHSSVFSLKIDRSNWCGRKKNHEYCNKTFEQVLSFFFLISNISFIYIWTALNPYPKFEESFWISKNVASSFFRILQIEHIRKT